MSSNLITAAMLELTKRFALHWILTGLFSLPADVLSHSFVILFVKKRMRDEGPKGRPRGG